MNKVAALHRSVLLGTVLEHLKAYRALRLPDFHALVILVQDGDAVPAFIAVLEVFVLALSTHAAFVLGYCTCTQWNIFVVHLGSF